MKAFIIQCDPDVQKINFHSIKIVEFAMIYAAAEFNAGPISLATVKRSLGFYGGKWPKTCASQAQEKTFQEHPGGAAEDKKEEKNNCC